MKIFYGIGILLTIAIFSHCESAPYKQGAVLYNTYCANCHMEDGTGLINMIPPLVATDYVPAHAHQLACIIRYGLADSIQVNGKYYAQEMVGISELTETEIANIINYVFHTWYPTLPKTSVVQVKEDLIPCQNSAE